MSSKKKSVVELRKKSGLTAQQCANILGLSLDKYLEKEQNSGEFYDYEAIKLCKVFNCKLDNFLS